MNHFHPLVVTLLMIFLGNSGFGQQVSERWQTCLGGSDWDEATGLTEIGGSYWMLAYSASTDGDIAFNHGGYDLWLVNMDTLGNLISEEALGGSGAEGSYGNILKINDSTFYVLGGTNSNDGNISNNQIHSPFRSYWVIKMKTDGTIIWDRVLGGSKVDDAWDCIVTEDEGIVVLGETESYDGFVSQYYGSFDIWMVKLSAEGELLWDFTLGSDGLELAGSITQTRDGGFIVIGSTDGGEGGNFDTDCNYHGYGDMWIVKLDSSRNIEWQQCYGGSYNDSGSNLLELEDGYLCLGYTWSDDGDVSGFHGYAGYPDYGGDIWVTKIDTVGNLLWQRCLGGTFNDCAWNIFNTSEGGYMIIGQTASDDGDVEGYNGISTQLYDDIWMAKITDEGELTWQYCYGGTGFDFIYRGVIQKGDYNYVMAISTDTDDWQCRGEFKPDIRVFEIGDSVLDVKHNTSAELTLFPNPASGQLHLMNPSSGHGSFILYDLQGKPMIIRPVKERETIIDVSHFPRGLYLWKVVQGHTVNSGKVVVE